jgi:cytochrome c-type biogenesis protein CcmH/NrfF
MKELICICGCARETVFECKCATAAQLRRQVMDYLEQPGPDGKPVFDMTTQAGQTAAYDAVLDFFVKQYGGEQVLASPRTKLSWLFPALGVLGGFGLLIIVGRRWLSRNAATTAPTAAGGAMTMGSDGAEHDAYADKLDDELADVD